MRLDIICNNYKLTNGLESVIQKKVGKLDKYFPDDSVVAKIVLIQQKQNCKMEISINYLGNQIRAEARADTMYFAIDEVLPKLERQVLRHKDKIYNKREMPINLGEYEFITGIPEEKESEFDIVKVKRFPVEAIEVKEAAENLELIDHDFYVFLNSATNQIEVVYRRSDGKIGLLQPYIED
ncbi:MAG: ribosome-associated translation inhibitor RaiA [Clostridia bacterium]|nr:ribosome-associated translation inhibitor RaiA [Clostridia bacterium]